MNLPEIFFKKITTKQEAPNVLNFFLLRLDLIVIEYFNN